MFQKNPGIFPDRVNDDSYRNNPLGGNPFPYPGNMPAALWNAEPLLLRWVTTGLPSGIFARAQWASPVFDLRPEFRNSGMPRSAGQGYLVAQAPSLSPTRAPAAVATTVSNTGAVPIWLPRGGTGKLWVQVTNLTSGPVVGQTGFGFQVLATELANINDPTDLQQIASVEDITANFVGRIPSAISQFQPPGSGYPPRYYRCLIDFQYRRNITLDPAWAGGAGNPMRITASYY
jgi:hypothetical protein